MSTQPPLERLRAELDAWEAKVRALRAELLARADLTDAALNEMVRRYEAAWRELRVLSRRGPQAATPRSAGKRGYQA